ncbi:tyrosine-type recombinase/integrase [Acaryochloris sp. 'Moss Beach']|uniref:tyrosine-type recombinase/integrase n=1 Tax=Acaryochloris sp. 'Moss Beach' TaxID=2740837 RepID=UPI001F3D4ED4|nr:tyrosine-type recombinase/integrase [Acaryochloris sp. 'Moss Beach']
MSKNYGVDIPEVKLITFPSTEVDQAPSPKSIPRGRPTRIPTPMDIRWPIVQEFLRNSNLSPNSQKLYERELKRFLGWTHLRWSDLTLRHLGQYKAYLMDLKVAEGKTLSKNSLNSALTALKSFFKWLTQFHPELCPTNPTKGVKFEKVPLPPAQNLTPEEMARVWDAIAQREQTQLRDLALVQLLSHNLRAGEVVTANVGSFDGRLMSIIKTKNNQPRLVPLSAEGQRVVQDYLDWRKEQGEELSAESPLILSHHQGWEGRRLSYHGVYFAVEDIGRLAELPDLHPHQFRHTSATEYLRMGLDPAHARRLTGHTDERSFRRYTVAAEQEAAITAFYRAEAAGQPLVFAQSLDRKQRQLLEALAEMTGKSPLYQDDLDEGTIDFAQLWQENLQELEWLVANVRALPEKLGMAGFGETGLEAVVEESAIWPQVSTVEVPSVEEKLSQEEVVGDPQYCYFGDGSFNEKTLGQSRRYHLPKAEDPGLAKCGATFIDPDSKCPVEYMKENFEVLLCKRCFRERRQPSKQAKPENFVTNEETAILAQTSTVERSLNAVQVGMKLWVKGKKKGKVRKTIEERVLEQFQMMKSKPRGIQYELMFVFDKEDDLSQIVAQMRWDMDLLAELDDCSVKVKWLDEVPWQQV